VTEIPEHLLARSRAARAKASGGSGDAGASEAPAAAAQASAGEPGTEVATTAAAAAPAVVEEPAAPVPPYVAAAQRRPRVPKFAIPVLASLPLWALLYAGTLTKPAGPEDPELAMGQQVYAANCASCHGSNGEGGTGRPLGDVLKTFPNRADHILWVHLGSPEPGTPYGDPSLDRKAGQGGYTTKMPAFKDSLSDEQIAAVVRYEREQFGGEEPTPSTQEDLEASGKTTAASGHPEAGGDQSGTSQEGGDSGTQANGVTEPGGADTGSNSSQADSAGGGNASSPSGSSGSSAPTDSGSGTSQTGE
jgi:mono/diheme cytochrome c family protein